MMNRRWKDSEVTNLLSLKAKGMSAEEIAEILGRDTVSIYNKIYRIQSKDPIIQNQRKSSTKRDLTEIIPVDTLFTIQKRYKKGYRLSTVISELGLYEYKKQVVAYWERLDRSMIGK